LSSLAYGRDDNAELVIEQLILPATVQSGETAVFLKWPRLIWIRIN